MLEAGRKILQEASDAASKNDCSQPGGDQANYLGLRIGGLFIILFVTCLGLLVPLISRGFTSVYFLARTFGAGVILATALIHILPEASNDLSNPCLKLSAEYPWAFAIAGIMLMVTFAMEYCVGTYLRYRFGSAAPIQHGAHPEAADVAVHMGNDEVVKAEAQQILSATVSSYTLEAGVILHSVFVGITYGVSTDLNTIKALTIALGLHQGIEAISLGCTFIDAKYSRRKYVLFGLTYVVVAPLGIAIGLGVGNAFHEGSRAALGTQGTLNAVSAGILVYNSVVDLIVPAFLGHGHTHGDPGVAAAKRPTWLTAAGFASMVTGYCIQALLGKWV